MPVTAYAFPQNGALRRIQLPGFQGDEGLGSWTITGPPQTVPVWDPANPIDGADANGLFPIQSVYLGICGRVVLGPGCGGYEALRNIMLSRCSCWLANVLTADGTVPAAGIAVNWAIKESSFGASEQLLAGQFTFNPATYNGTLGGLNALLGHVSGILGNQYEFWASVASNGGSGVPLLLSVQMDVDRMCGALAAYRGSNSGGSVGLPVVNPKVG